SYTFIRTQLRPIQLATSTGPVPGTGFGATRDTDWGSFRKIAFWFSKSFAIRSRSLGLGLRLRQCWKSVSRRSSQLGGAFSKTRTASDWAASANTGSLSRFKACKGVSDLGRRVAETFELGSSKFTSCE